jgi:peptide chain release factor subunit 1
MFGYADVEKLRNAGALGAAVLSLYLPVPLDPAGLRGLAAEAGALMARATQAAGKSHGDWLGRTVAIFTCRERGLFEVLPLPCLVPEGAVLAGRPYIRPLLAVLRRCPDYQVVVADHEHAWVLAVSGGQAKTVARRIDPVLRSPGFGGWYGLEAHRVQQRVIRLSRRHYQDTARILAGIASWPCLPLVIGGHRDSIAGLLRALPAATRESFAGSFHTDPHTLTEAKVTQLAAPVVSGWMARRDQELSAEILDAVPGGLGAVGVPACLAAVSADAVACLLLPEQEGMIPGFACDRCGALSADDGICPACDAGLHPVPDLLEEMAQRALDSHSQVSVIGDAPFTAAAKLRFPVAERGIWR